MEVLIMAGQLLLGLSILVGLHELGHLLTAKFFGMRVEQYSIGFPPKIWGKKFGETEYSIGAIPLGGFVKISGMIDESLDTDAMKQPPKHWEFRAKPAWQRLIVMLGGIIVNIITGVLIFIVMTYRQGGSYLSSTEVNKNGIAVYELGKELGLRTGDRIIRINGKPYEDFADVRSSDVLLGSNSYYTVQRGSQQLDVYIPNNFVEKLSDRESVARFIEPIDPFVVGEVSPGTPGARAGLKAGDRIVALNGRPIAYFQQLRDQLEKLPGKPVDLSVERGGRLLGLNLTLTPEGKIGFASKSLLQPTIVKYSLVESIGIGTQRAFQVVFDNIRGFRKIFKGEVSASKALSGPIGIAQNLFGGIWDWSRFWFVTGLLSMALAFMNILPIPALDGGHATFLIYEIVSGRAPSDKFLENAQKVGMVLLLALMAFAIGNDLVKAIF
ncbi:MAG: RIP metalloprotease RseP [Sphingobacteriaceae bacterium]|nr:RIP metalloprotease RseP [Cytophagaceae bacterium]